MRLRLLASIAFIFFILAYSSQAAVVGVSPSITNFQKMIKGGYAETIVTASTSITAPLKAQFSAEGEIKDWISLQPDTDSFIFSAENPYTFTMIIQPPEDAKNGNYTGMLMITTDELATVESGAGSSVIAQVGLLIYVEIVGDEIIACRAGALSTSSAEINNPFSVRAIVYNDGNVRIRPKFKVDVWDQYRTRIVFSKSFIGDTVLPTKSKQMSREVENSLQIGQYFTDIYIEECNFVGRTTFDIVEKGQLADSGTLIALRTNKNVYVKETLPIGALFRNDGSRKVVAQFKGEIKSLATGKIVQVLESDALEVPAYESNTIEFNMYFVPTEIGEYQISGRVVYNNKITFEEATATFKAVEKEGLGISSVLIIILYFILGFLILIMIGKIRKAKKKKRRY